MHRKVYQTYIYIILLSFLGLQAQTQIITDTSNVQVNTPDINSTASLDSIPTLSDTTQNELLDSLPLSKLKYEKSPDALTDEIDYGSAGRKKIDLKNKIVHLWDKAYVNYQDIQVKGDYITFDFENNLATAVATYDETGKLISKATFVQGETSFQYDYLKYNFKTEKGIVKQAVTKEGELFVHGSVTKFISAKDSSASDIIYNKNAIVTSCNHEEPHFGIRTNKLKVVPEKLAIIGPSRLEIASIPTPLWLPFGFFPIMNGKSSGLILPKSYDFSDAWGFGFQNLGYYFPINDYFDAKITGDVYLRGSWAINGEMNYNKKYKYNGNFLVTRSSRNNEDNTTGGYLRSNSYHFRWTHRQDNKAHPFRTFSSSVDLVTAGFNQQNRTDAYSRNRDNVSSTINYSYQFGDSPWTLTSGANFTQSLSKKTVNIVLPEGKINMRQIYPFKKKERVGKEKWYEKIGVNYNSSFRNYLEATDTTFYTADAWKNAKYGMEHSASSNASFKFLKYFNFNPTVNYKEIWFFKQVSRELSDELVIDSIGTFTDSEGIITTVYDTLYGEVIENIESAFLPFRTGSANAAIATKLFWTEQKSKGFIRGFRHTVTPSLSINYSPDTKSRYEETFDTDFRDDVYEPETYSIIPSGVFSASPREANFGLNFGAENIVEIKYFSKKDSIDKKLKITNFRVSTNYNFVKDSFKLAAPMVSGRTSFFKNRSSLNYRFTWDPYKLENGRLIDTYVWNDGFELPRLANFTINTTTRLKFHEIRSWITGEKKEEKSNKKGPRVITLGELFDEFSLDYKIDYSYRNINGVVTKGISSHSLNITGNIAVSDKWNLRLGNFGYDFARKGYTYPDFGFSRDLHCWSMNFSWQPRGAIGFTSASTSTYNFFIGVSSNSLEFIKYNYGRGNFDGRF